MSRRFQDDDEYDPRPEPKNSNTVLIVLLVLGGVGLLSVVGCLALWVIGFGAERNMQVEARPAQPKPEAKATAPPPGSSTRAEFMANVMGKTPDEVIAAVGRPDETQEGGNGAWWYYKNVTTDPVTGKTDPRVQVKFEGGRVTTVNF